MERIRAITDKVIHDFTLRRMIAMLLGNLLIGLGCTGLKLSMMGNDSFTAAMMAFSEGMGIGQGGLQLTVNAVLMVFELVWGYRYIGLGSLVNMGLLGYVVQYSSPVMAALIGTGAGHGLAYCLIYMLLALTVVAFGVSMYQQADMGVSPYDYLAIGMTEYSSRPYFLNRVMTDATCVAAILVAVLTGFIGWGGSHLGIGTVLGAFCLGPLVSLFDRINKKWIR